MTTPLSYGALMDDAARILAAGVAQAGQPFTDPPDAAATLAARGRLLGVLHRHASFLAAQPTPSLDAEAPAEQPNRTRERVTATLVRGLQAAAAGETDRWDHTIPTHPLGAGCARAADTVALAHDVLAGHRTPNGRPRSADARYLAQPDARWAAIGRVADLTATLAATHTTLTAPLNEALGRGTADRLDSDHPLAAAAGAITALTHATGAGWRGLDEVEPQIPARTQLLPLRGPADALTALDWLRNRIAHAADGQTRISAAGIHAHTTLAAGLLQHTAAVTSAAATAAERLYPPGVADPLRNQLHHASRAAITAAAAWALLGRDWQPITSPGRGIDPVHELGPAILRAIRKQGTAGDTPRRTTGRPELERTLYDAWTIAVRLPDLADDLAILTKRASGDVLLPTRIRSADSGRLVLRHTPIPGLIAEQLIANTATAAAQSRAAAVALTATAGIAGPAARPRLTEQFLRRANAVDIDCAPPPWWGSTARTNTRAVHYSH